MTKQVEEQLEIIKTGVQMSAPLVADFFNEDTPLRDYSRALYAYQATDKHRERQKLLKKKTRLLLEQVFAKDEIEQANIDWDTDWKINIIDHHNFLSHPLLVSTSIIGNMWQIPSGKPEGVIVFSDSGVPMNNFFHKRGMKYKDEQLNLHPTKRRHMLYYAAPLMDKLPLAEAGKKKGFEGKDLEFLTKMQEQLEATAKHPLCKTFKDQVSRANYEFWKQLFAEEVRDQIPDLFYITNEDLCHEMLKEYLPDPENLFSRILFDQSAREKIIQEFVDISGCWDKVGEMGTMFFWGVDEDKEKVSLKIENEELVDRDGKSGIRVKLQADALLKAMDDGLIYPSMFMVYGVGIFYCGVRPLCGYGSMTYQTKMKDAWIRSMKEIDSEEVLLLESISTKGFIGGPIVSLGHDSEKGFEGLYALDVIARGGFDRNYLEQLAQVPFNQLLKPGLLDIYDSYLTPEQKEELEAGQELTLTPSDLMEDGFQWLK